MPTLLDEDLRHLHSLITDLGEQVLFSFRQTITALRDADGMLAYAVIGRDDLIDHAEIGIEKACQRILTLQGPIGTDLRYVMSVLKINVDLERIGDEARGVAKELSALIASSTLRSVPEELLEEAGAVFDLLTAALGALRDRDVVGARQVIQMDKHVDSLYKSLQRRLVQRIAERPEAASEMVAYLKMARDFERAGDHCANVCEEILFAAEGAIVRHSQEKS